MPSPLLYCVCTGVAGVLIGTQVPAVVKKAKPKAKVERVVKRTPAKATPVAQREEVPCPPAVAAAPVPLPAPDYALRGFPTAGYPLPPVIVGGGPSYVIPIPTKPTEVPEPAALGLLGLGVFLLARRRALSARG